MHIDKDDVIGQLIAAFMLKLEEESPLMKLLCSRTPLQRRRKGLQCMDDFIWVLSTLKSDITILTKS